MRIEIAASLIALTAFLPATTFAQSGMSSGPAAALKAAASGALLMRAETVTEAAATATPWQSVAAKVLELGTYSDEDSPLPSTYGLTDIDGPKDGSHRANYANLWGSKDSNGVFQVESASLVSEDWTLEPASRWSFDQWLFTLKSDGAIDGVTHRVVVENVGGSVISIDYDPQVGADPAGFQVKARSEYDALVRRWIAFRPN